MQRVVIYLERRTDLPRPLFFDWWLGQHRSLAEQLPGLRQYAISLVVAEEQESPFDGVAELWLDDLVTAEAAAPAQRARQPVPTPTNPHRRQRRGEHPERVRDLTSWPCVTTLPQS